MSETEDIPPHRWPWWFSGYFGLIAFGVGVLVGLAGGRLLARHIERENAAIVARMDMLEARFEFLVGTYLTPRK